MNETQARTFFEARTAYIQRINRSTKAELASIYREDMREQGRQIIFGGPSTKAELINALVELHYPLAKVNEATHVLYHSADFPNEVCAWCDPHPCPTCGAIDVCDYSVGGGPVVNGRHVVNNRQNVIDDATLAMRYENER